MRFLSLLMVISLALLVGCGAGKKDRADASASRGQAAQADEFESGADPPFTANTHFATGQLTESMGNLDLAAKHYQEALKLEPKHNAAMYRLGLVLTQQRKFTDAVNVWNRYIEMTNHAPEAYNNLAYTYEMAGQVQAAETTYRRGIERDPAQAACRLNYGRMLARHNRIEEAVAQMSQVLKPAEVSYNLGMVFQELRRPEQAKAYYQRALEQDPNLSDARARLAALK